MIVVAGEALIDLVAEPDGRYRALPGGSPANVAVGLARLGHRTEMLARISRSPFGRIIRDHLDGNGVGLHHARIAPEPATLAVVTRNPCAEPHYDFYLDGTPDRGRPEGEPHHDFYPDGTADRGRPGGEPHYDFYLDGTADWGWSEKELPARLPAGTRALCTGSLALAIEPGAGALTGLLRRERGRVPIVLDPNIRPDVMDTGPAGLARAEANVALADVVKVSAADLETLAPGEAVPGVAARWLSLGPRLVVVTCGADGAYAVTSGGVHVDVPARPVDVVDTIGAGDAFTSGLVGALDRHGLLGDGAQGIDTADHVALRKIIDHATLVAALTCTRPGADPPHADTVVSAGGAATREGN